MKIIADVVKRMLSRDVQKAAATFVSRPVLNADEWAAWAQRWGVPQPVAAADMHVTVIASTVAFKAPLTKTAINVDLSYAGACFAMFGPDEDCLVCTFRSWELFCRNDDLRGIGASPTFAAYRPHLTLSYDASGFTLPDAAMQDVPGWIVLGPETMATAPVDLSDQIEEAADGDDDSELDGDIDAIVILAADLLKTQGEQIPAPAYYDLADVAKRRMTAGAAKRLADAAWAPEAIRKAATDKKGKGKAKGDAKLPVTDAAPPKVAGDMSCRIGGAETRKRVEREVTISVSAIPEEITKKFQVSNITKANDEEQIVMGIASVSTVNGEILKDLHDEGCKTQALVEFNRSLISGSRAGKFDHEGDVCTEVVAGLVLTEDWQKSLGIELGCEPYLVEIHVPDPKDWAEVKKGDWMLSIAGLMWYYEDADEGV